jgi:hypothetical protein
MKGGEERKVGGRRQGMGFGVRKALRYSDDDDDGI